MNDKKFDENLKTPETSEENSGKPSFLTPAIITNLRCGELSIYIL